MLHETPYVGIYGPEDPDYHPLAASKNLFVDAIDRSLAETILEHLAASDAPMRVAQLRVLGGAMARVPADATAFAHRQRRIMVNVASFYAGDEDRPKREAWVESLVAVLRGDDRAAYVNFINDEGAGAGARRLSAGDLGAARGDQGALRPDEPVPAQPEHPAGGRRDDQGRPRAHLLRRRGGDAGVPARRAAVAVGRGAVQHAALADLQDRPERAGRSTRRRAAAARRRTHRRGITRSR